MFEHAKDTASSAARKAGLITAGALCVLIGAGFLTAAAWIFLVAATDALTAAGIIGAVYAGAGFVTLGIALSGSSKPPRAPERERERPATAPDAPPLMQAFLYGMQAGASAERR